MLFARGVAAPLTRQTGPGAPSAPLTDKRPTVGHNRVVARGQGKLKITPATVRDAISRGLSRADIAKAAGCSERTLRRKLEAIRREDPAALELAEEAGERVRVGTVVHLERPPGVPATSFGPADDIPPEAWRPPAFDAETSDRDAARAFLRWALQTPLAVDPAKIAACRVLLSDGDSPPPAPPDHAGMLERLEAATASVELEGDDAPPAIEATAEEPPRWTASDPAHNVN